jgi:adenylate cyclase
VRDAFVLIGPAGNFQHDQHPTPFGPMDGVEIHANAIATLMRGDAPREAPAAVGIVSIFVLALATARLLSVAVHPLGKLGLLVAIGAAYFAVAQTAFAWRGVVLLVAAPLWTVAGGGVLGVAMQVVAERLERLRVRRTLDRYVSKQVAEEILRHGEEYAASLGGERRNVTILFSDIRGFTTISEQSSPVELVAQLNEYLTVMVDVVMKYDGTLDKFVGDAIMTVYGAPLSRGAAEDAWRAVQTAAEMRTRLAELQQRWRAAGKPELRIGIGLNHGEVVVGNIGSPQRMEYTVIGDPVNVASRVEGLNKEFGTDILLTESVYELVKDRVEVKRLEATAVKGREQKVNVYALEWLKT